MYKEYVIAYYNSMKDGDNLHKSYILVKLSEIRGLRFKVGI